MGKVDKRRLAQIAFDALIEIARLTKTVKDDRVLEVLRAIRTYGQVFQRGVKGEVTAATVEAALAKLKSTLTDNDAKADTALKKRFGKG